MSYNEGGRSIEQDKKNIYQIPVMEQKKKRMGLLNPDTGYGTKTKEGWGCV